MVNWLVLLYAGLVGACVGSFLNVCVYRWPEGLSVVSPPSRCPACETPIRWRDNLPVLGWLLLRGRCRACGARISIQYPLIELATALLWVLAVVRHGLSWQALGMALFFSILLGIALTDARTYTIPDQFTLGGLVLGFAFAIAPGGIGVVDAILGAVLGLALVWGFGLLGKVLFRKEMERQGTDTAMGGGDVLMMGMIGAFLGPVAVGLTLLLGAAIGSLIFLPLRLLGRDHLVPFGVFLAIGAFATAVVGDALIAWYVDFAQLG